MKDPFSPLDLATPDLGDLIVCLLASTLAGLRDRLYLDGFENASDLVADLVDVTDEYVTKKRDPWPNGGAPPPEWF